MSLYLVINTRVRVEIRMNEKRSHVIRSWRCHERFLAIIVSLGKKPLKFACELKRL